MSKNNADAASVLLGCKSWGDVRQTLHDAPEKLKGDTFELLVQQYLRLSEEHGFKRVWSTHGEVPVLVLRKLHLDPRDTKGIDLIAETDFGEYVAVQAKYHQDENRSLAQKECEGLVAGMTLAKGRFLRGLVCTNAIEHSRNLKYEIQYLKYERWSVLDEEFFGRLHAALRGERSKPPVAHEWRDHQREAVEAAVEELFKKGRDRCRIIMACATGKTHTAFYLAEQLRARRVLIAVPNLSLADQHIQKLAPEYAARGLHAKWLAVCSDKSVGEDDDASLSMPREDLRIVNVSTDVEEVAGWFRKYSGAERLVVFSTYQSGAVLAEAAKKAGLVFDLGVFDEAHRTAGPKNGPFAYLLHAKNVAIKKRVFMTATERVNRLDLDHIIGMNEPEWYGEKVYDLSTKKAVERGIIADYRVVILACSADATERLIRERKLLRVERWRRVLGAGMLANAIGLRQVMRDSNLHHGLSFHSTIKRMEAYAQVQSALSQDLEDGLGAMEVFAFSCEDSAGRRRSGLDAFESATRALAANVRVFVEGVDCPDLDLVAFVDPKQSRIDIVQAVGRAIRPARGRSDKVAYVYVPVLVGKDGTYSNDAFRQVMAILRALKEKDESITYDIKVAAQEGAFDEARSRLQVRLADGLSVDPTVFARDLATRIWEGTSEVRGIGQEWTPARVVEEILDRQGKGTAINSRAVQDREFNLYSMARYYFGSWDEALKAAGIAPSTVWKHRKWTKEEILDAIKARTTEGRPLNASALAKDDTGLMQTAIKFFGSWPNALRAVGIDPLSVRGKRGSLPGAKTLRGTPLRSRDDIKTSIQQRKEHGAQMYAKAVSADDASLYREALRAFGTWTKALLYSGVDPSSVRPKRGLNKEEIIHRIRQLQRRGVSLNVKAVRDSGQQSLNTAAQRVFGSWDEALRAAGFDPADVRLKNSWSKDSIVAEIRARKAQGLPLNAWGVVRDHNALYQAASIYFGSWEKALVAAGVAPADARRKRTRWTEADVIRAIRDLQAKGVNLRDFSHNKARTIGSRSVFRGATSVFGSWSAALVAAGLDSG